MKLVNFLLVSFVIQILCTNVPTEVANGFFPGHSGPFIIAPENFEQGDSFFVTKNGPKYNGEEISEVSFGDFLAHLTSLPPFTLTGSRSSFPVTNLFEKPKALVLVSIDGVGSDKIGSKSELLKKTSPVKINKESYPSDAVSFQTTLLSSAFPSKHGITGRTWINAHGETVKAYLGTGQSRTANFPDVFSQIFEGRALTLAFGTDQQLVSASTVHKAQLLTHPFWNNYAYYWDCFTKTTETLSPVSRLEQNLLVSEQKLVKSIQEKTLFSFFDSQEFSFQVENNQVTIIAGDVSATFDLKSKDIGLFVELSQLQTVGASLESSTRLKQLIVDSIPDFFAFTAVSVSDLKQKYGEDSEQSKVAFMLIDLAVQKFLSVVEQVYDGSISSHVIFLGTHSYKTNEKIFSLFQGEFPMQLETIKPLLPYVYFNPTMLTLPAEFKVYAQETSSSDIDPSEFLRPKRAIFPSTGNDDNIAFFQICLWFPILMVFVLVLVVLSMCWIPNERDTLLYSVDMK